MGVVGAMGMEGVRVNTKVPGVYMPVINMAERRVLTTTRGVGSAGTSIIR